VVEERCDLDLLRLRRETAADHEAVEGAVPLMQPGLDVAEYVSCLRRMHGVVAAWEERAGEAAPEWLGLMLTARRRAGMLESDLACFGAAKDDGSRAAIPEITDLPSLLGAMYVMEGSTLGGQLIARHVATTLQLEDGRGNAFFRGHGEQTGRMWKEFCEVMKVRVSEDESEAVVVAAKAMFRTFGEWMQGRSEVNE